MIKVCLLPCPRIHGGWGMGGIFTQFKNRKKKSTHDLLWGGDGGGKVEGAAPVSRSTLDLFSQSPPLFTRPIIRKKNVYFPFTHGHI